MKKFIIVGLILICSQSFAIGLLEGGKKIISNQNEDQSHHYNGPVSHIDSSNSNTPSSVFAPVIEIPAALINAAGQLANDTFKLNPFKK